MSYTPGPWYKDEYGELRGSDEGIVKVYALGVSSLTTRVDDPEPEANTRLMIAAPELLEALDNALKLITSLTGPDDEIAQTVIREGMDAIKKARGEL